MTIFLRNDEIMESNHQESGAQVELMMTTLLTLEKKLHDDHEKRF